MPLCLCRMPCELPIGIVWHTNSKWQVVVQHDFEKPGPSCKTLRVNGSSAAGHLPQALMPCHRHAVPLQLLPARPGSWLSRLLFPTRQRTCTLAGGYVVVKAIQDGMRLPPEAVMPSMASLRDFGNTSVSLTWYGESIGLPKPCTVVPMACRALNCSCIDVKATAGSIGSDSPAVS